MTKLTLLTDIIQGENGQLAGASYNPTGQPVFGSNGDNVGTVHGALVDETSRIRYLLVDVGGWFANKMVAIPVGLSRLEDQGVYFDTLTREQVTSLRNYVPGQEFTFEAQLADESTWLKPGQHSHAEETGGSRVYNYEKRGELFDAPTRLRLLEERLQVEKEKFVAGSVEVGKRVETHPENINVELKREEIVIERHPVSGERAVEGNVVLGSDRETIRVDLEAERADVTKQAYVTEEVEIGKRTHTETQTFTETVGKEVLEVNKTGVDVRADQTATGTLRQSTTEMEDELARRSTSTSNTSSTEDTLTDDKLGRP